MAPDEYGSADSLRRRQLRYADVYANARFLLVETQSGRGLLRPDPGSAWHVFASLPSDEELGTALLDALARSRTDLSVAEMRRRLEDGTWEVRRRALMERFRFRSLDAVHRGTALLHVRREAGGPLVLTPTRQRRGAAWEPNHNSPVEVPGGAAPAEVGAAVRGALHLCGGFDFALFESGRAGPTPRRPSPSPPRGASR